MKFIVNEHETGLLIRDYLRDVRGLSRRILIAAKSPGGKILVNGKPATVRYCLQAGDRLEVTLPREEVSKWLFPEEMDLRIVYEDDAVIVLDKPPGIATLPSPKHKSGTIANGLISYYRKINHPHTVHVVTRLDRETSGLILIAKERLAHSLLARQQKQFLIKRKYHAIAEGKLERAQGTIHAPIARKPGSIIEREINTDGKEAITHYVSAVQGKAHTLVEIELETGRTHQIRVHFSHIGHPLAGDNLYGGGNTILGRQALHCSSITFEHPYTGKLIHLRAELPEDFRDALTQMDKEV